MPRSLSERTVDIYYCLWDLPWACAADLTRFTDIPAPAVANVLLRGVRKGWLLSARLGRVHDAVDRYVFSNAGVEEFETTRGWRRYWWHTSGGLRALARRLEVVEMAYLYLPVLWQSNLVIAPRAYVVRHTQLAGEPVMDVSLEQSDWSSGSLVRLRWLRSGPFEAIAVYSNGDPGDGLIHLPVLWRGDFQKPQDISQVRRDMKRVFSEDPRWGSLPLNQSAFESSWPGMIVFCPDRAAAAVLHRNWVESPGDHGFIATPAIVDAQGQVTRAMRPPAAYWWKFEDPPSGGPLKNIGRTVELLSQGAYAAVNGRQAWRTYRCVEGCHGIELDQMATSVGVGPTAQRGLVEPMVNSNVLTVRAGGHYLDVSGRGLLADSQRRTPSRAIKRFGIYTKRGGEFRRAQRLHNQGLAETINQLRKHGFEAFPAGGIPIDYGHGSRLIRVVPDGYVVLPPGVVVALEYERSAKSQSDVNDKADKYERLVEIGHPLPVLFVTDADKADEADEADKAAERFCRRQQDYLLATTLERLKRGPHGRAEIQGYVVGGEPGCWGYQYSTRDAPTFDAPIDLWSQMYVQSNENQAWRVPLKNPFRIRSR